MQDNEPLMRALAKLIRVNSPDLVLFVGEALVGNEAVDQLEKFNRYKLRRHTYMYMYIRIIGVCIISICLCLIAICMAAHLHV